MGSSHNWKRLCAIGAAFASLGSLDLRAQTPGPSDADIVFRSAVQPFLTKHCTGCHNEKLKTANLDLSAFHDSPSSAKQPEIWEKVRDKLAAGKMPPVGLPAPAKPDVEAVTRWIDTSVLRSATRRDDPGRVLARRLNRVEYNNTVRDLLGIAFRPADEFPVDDSGYGFDNIADVLTVSPLLMEKYLSAAKKASRLAVYGDTWPSKPVLISHQLSKRSYDVAPSNAAEAGASYLPYSMRGNLSASFAFPVDAEYEIRFRVMNLRNANNNNQNYLDVVNGKAAAVGNFDEDAGVPGAGRGGAGRGAAGAGRGAAGRGAAGARGRGGARGGRSQEEILAAVEKARVAAPPLKVALLLDGKPILNDVIEGDTNYGYARGEFVAKVPVKAGEHLMRVSFPELADLPDPRLHLNIDMRRKVFADYLDVVGPFNPSKAAPASYKQIFICGHEPGKHGAACGRQILSNLMLRAYRRPPLAAEVEEKLRLIAVARKEGDSFEEGVRLALEAILASPNFLFKLERDPKTSAAPQSAHLVSDYELATRLSYFLWASMPDAELFRAAQARTLRNPGILTTQVRRMMADPKANNLVENFAAQWLQLRNLGRTKPDGTRFGKIDDELLADMKTETNLFVQAIIREDRSILDFIDAPFTYLNGPLARHYGISGIDGEEFRRVKLDGEQRGGLLGQAAILTVSSYPTRTSIPVRGKWVLENLLGTPPPPPPPDVPVLDESKVGTTVSLRERFEQHRADPNCSGCHTLMDPIGFGLESYDAVGTWRTMDGQVPIDTSGVLPDGRTFKGAMGLKQLLKTQSDAFTHNLAEKLLTFALGRGLERSDSQAVNQIVKQTVANDFKFSTLVLEAVNSKPFQMRSAPSTKVAQGAKP